MLHPKVSHFLRQAGDFPELAVQGERDDKQGGFPLNATKQERICQQGKQDFGFGFVFFFLLMGDALFSFSMWKLRGSHKAAGCASTARGAAPSSPMAAGRVSPSAGTPRNGQGGKPGTTEAPFLGKAGARRFLPSRCPRADAAAAGDSQRAGERLPRPLAPHQPLISLLHSPMD